MKYLFSIILLEDIAVIHHFHIVAQWIQHKCPIVLWMILCSNSRSAIALSSSCYSSLVKSVNRSMVMRDKSKVEATALLVGLGDPEIWMFRAESDGSWEAHYFPVVQRGQSLLVPVDDALKLILGGVDAHMIDCA